jgi:predicted esterase
MWRLDRGCSVLRAVHEHIASEPALDGRRVYLAGLSNGAMGLTRAAADHGDRYRGFVFISPIIEPGVVLSPAFARNCGKKPALIIHGEKDRRIPADAVRAGAQILASRSMSVTSRFYEGEDHFLLFSRRESIVRELARWLAECESEAAE